MDYTVKPLGKTCTGTGDPLQPGEPCHSVLIDEQGDKIRYDFSERGWNESAPVEYFAYWKTTVPALVVDDRPRPMDAEQLFEFFEQTLEDRNPAQEKIKYVIALLLMQKKRLQLDGTHQDEGNSWLVLSGSQGEGPYEVPDQSLSDAEITQLQQELNSTIYR